jgi:DNA-binding CsgD family transcriptional regulator
MRLLAEPAVTALGFAVAGHSPAGAITNGPAGGAPAPAVIFVPLAAGGDCRRASAAARRLAAPDCSAAPPPLVVAYGAGPAALLAAHRAHGCADLVLQLTAADGGPRFAYPPAHDAVSAAGISAREADALVLLLQGLTTAAVAARLGVAVSTARSHCRAVLRKLGAGDRRALRALLLAGPSAQCAPGPAAGAGGASPGPSLSSPHRFDEAGW